MPCSLRAGIHNSTKYYSPYIENNITLNITDYAETFYYGLSALISLGALIPRASPWAVKLRLSVLKIEFSIKFKKPTSSEPQTFNVEHQMKGK